MTEKRRIEKLHRNHGVEGFDCGRIELNKYILRYAWANQQANAAQTYVGLEGNSLIGYYTLVVGAAAYEGAPERLAKGLARHPVPVMVLARLAVDKRWQGKGVGAALLKDALSRTLQAADIAGIRAMVVHAKDDQARNFYEHFNFSQSPTDPLHLYILLKDVKPLFL